MDSSACFLTRHASMMTLRLVDQTMHLLTGRATRNSWVLRSQPSTSWILAGVPYVRSLGMEMMGQCGMGLVSPAWEWLVT